MLQHTQSLQTYTAHIEEMMNVIKAHTSPCTPNIATKTLFHSLTNKCRDWVDNHQLAHLSPSVHLQTNSSNLCVPAHSHMTFGQEFLLPCHHILQGCWHLWHEMVSSMTFDLKKVIRNGKWRAQRGKKILLCVIKIIRAGCSMIY